MNTNTPLFYSLITFTVDNIKDFLIKYFIMKLVIYGNNLFGFYKDNVGCNNNFKYAFILGNIWYEFHIYSTKGYYMVLRITQRCEKMQLGTFG